MRGSRSFALKEKSGGVKKDQRPSSKESKGERVAFSVAVEQRKETTVAARGGIRRSWLPTKL